MVVFPPDTAGSPACSAKDNGDNYDDYYDPTETTSRSGLPAATSTPTARPTRHRR